MRGGMRLYRIAERVVSGGGGGAGRRGGGGGREAAELVAHGVIASNFSTVGAREPP